MKLKIEINRESCFLYDLEHSREFTGHIPAYADLKLHSCAGNLDFGSDIPYCRLLWQLGPLVEYFNRYESYDRGHMQIVSEGRRVSVNDDAQNLFVQAFWLIIGSSPCSVIGSKGPLFRHYRIDKSTASLLYALFTTFLIEEGAQSPLPQLIDRFVEQLRVYQTLIRNLLERLKPILERDSTRNGLVIVSALLELTFLKIEEIEPRLRQATSLIGLVQIMTELD